VLSYLLSADGRNRDGTVTASDKKVVFISYGRADALDFAKRLATDLEQRGGHAAWLDLSDIEKGGEFDVRIEDGIKSSDIFAAVMSLRSAATRLSLRSTPRRELFRCERVQTGGCAPPFFSAVGTG